MKRFGSPGRSIFSQSIFQRRGVGWKRPACLSPAFLGFKYLGRMSEHITKQKPVATTCTVLCGRTVLENQIVIYCVVVLHTDAHQYWLEWKTLKMLQANRFLQLQMRMNRYGTGKNNLKLARATIFLKLKFHMNGEKYADLNSSRTRQ